MLLVGGGDRILGRRCAIYSALPFSSRLFAHSRRSLHFNIFVRVRVRRLRSGSEQTHFRGNSGRLVFVFFLNFKIESNVGLLVPEKDEYFWLDSLFVMVLIHFAFYMSLVWMAQPDFIQSTGLHEPIGPCNETIPVQTVSGMVRL